MALIIIGSLALLLALAPAGGRAYNVFELENLTGGTFMILLFAISTGASVLLADIIDARSSD